MTVELERVVQLQDDVAGEAQLRVVVDQLGLAHDFVDQLVELLQMADGVCCSGRHSFVGTNLRCSRSFFTSSPRNTRPFIATYTPGGNDCTAANAIPILKVASLSLNRAGESAPVRTMVLFGIA